MFHELGIGCVEAVPGGPPLPCPGRAEISRRDVAHLREQLLPQRSRSLTIEGDDAISLDAGAAAISIAGRPQWHTRLAVLLRSFVLPPFAPAAEKHGRAARWRRTSAPDAPCHSWPPAKR